MGMMGFGGLPPIVGILTLSISEFEAKLGEAKLQMRETARVGGSQLGGGPSALGGMVKTGLFAAAAAAAAFGAASIKAAGTYNSALEMVHTQAGASQREVDALRGKVLQLAPAAGTGPQQLAEALFHVESVGLRGKAAMDALTMSARLAKVGHADLEATSNALAAAFVTQAKDTRSAAQAAGILNAIIGVGNMRMEDLVGALSTGLLPVAKNMGLGLTDVGAALAVMTDRGMRADEAATRLKMTLSLVTAPTDKAQRALHDMGLSTFSLAHDLRKPDGLAVMLQDLHTHLERLGKDRQAADISAIFGGGRSSAAIQTLLNGLTAYDQKLGDIKRHSGDFGESWRATTQQAAFQWDQLKAGAQSFMIAVGNYLIPRLISFAKIVGTEVGPDLKGLAHAWNDNKRAIGDLAAITGAELVVALRLAVHAMTLAITIAGGLGRAADRTAQSFAVAFYGMARNAMDSVSTILHAAARFATAFHLPWAAGLRRAADDFDRFEAQTLGVMDSLRRGMTLAGALAGRGLASGLESQTGLVRAAAQRLVSAASISVNPRIGQVARNAYAHGGVIREPVIGWGVRSGVAYSFAEQGPELVTPLGGRGHAVATGTLGTGGGPIIAFVSVPVYLDGHEITRTARTQLLQTGHRNPSVFSGRGVKA